MGLDSFISTKDILAMTILSKRRAWAVRRMRIRENGPRTLEEFAQWVERTNEAFINRWRSIDEITPDDYPMDTALLGKAVN